MRAATHTPEYTFNLPIEGMTCASCVMRVEKALRKVPGVEDASVNLGTESAHVRVDAGVSADILRAAIDKAEYQARPRRACLTCISKPRRW